MKEIKKNLSDSDVARAAENFFGVSLDRNGASEINAQEVQDGDKRLYKDPFPAADITRSKSLVPKRQRTRKK